MECISVFDMLKIGIGPSSSHTLGPWRAAERWLELLKTKKVLHEVMRVRVHMYGSLSLTGKGHATDYAVMLGLSGADPEHIPVEDIQTIVADIKKSNCLHLPNGSVITFEPETDIVFHKKFLPFHANGLKFEATLSSGKKTSQTYYSIGGGFVVVEERKNKKKQAVAFAQFPYPVTLGTELLAHCNAQGLPISEIVLANEYSLCSEAEVDVGLKRIWDTMLECMYIGCHTEGKLPGGLDVARRAFNLNKRLMRDQKPYQRGGMADYHSSNRSEISGNLAMGKHLRTCGQ